MVGRGDLRAVRPDRVCLVKPSSLGDVVHALPVLAALRDHWPEARFTWVINQGLAGLVEGHPLLDEVIRFDRARVGVHPSGIARFGGFLAELSRRRFDVAIDLQGLLRSSLMTWATRAPIRVGLASAREGATCFYTHRIPSRPEKPHAVEILLEIPAAFGAEVSSPRFVLAVTEADRRFASETLAEVGRPRLTLNLGARWVTKRWPVERFARIARWSVEQLGAGLIAVGAPEDRPLVAALRDAIRPHGLLDLSGRTTLPQLAAIAAESDLFLSNDSGPLHLAAATGTRVVGVYTCTRPEWTGPYGPRGIAVRTSVACAGSCRKTCSDRQCMTELEADRVWRVVRDALRAGRSQAGPHRAALPLHRSHGAIGS